MKQFLHTDILFKGEDRNDDIPISMIVTLDVEDHLSERSESVFTIRFGLSSYPIKWYFECVNERNRIFANITRHIILTLN
jgi:hypothetical protein